jgi:hypothetical protein
MNWIMTGDHLAQSIGAGYWAVAGVDLFLMRVARLLRITVSLAPFRLRLTVKPLS